jgi:hypothetical protein
MNDTLDILKDLGHILDVLQIHGSCFRDEAPVGQELAGVFNEVVEFGAYLVHSLRWNKLSIFQPLAFFLLEHVRTNATRRDSLQELAHCEQKV